MRRSNPAQKAQAHTTELPRFSAHKGCRIAHLIGVLSGKGGVGKSFVTGLLAQHLKKRGYSVGILDADITGASIPKMFGLSKAHASLVGKLIIPATSSSNIKIMSSNLMLANQSDPVLWRGPLLTAAIRQFWSEVLWGDLDYLLIDMPPGTSDVSLTVFQSLPLEGLILVTSPQDLVRLIVEKALRMAEIMKIPVLGLIENMSYFTCPSCAEKHEIFGKSKTHCVAREYGLNLLAKLPLLPEIMSLCDEGRLDAAKELKELDEALSVLEGLEGIEGARGLEGFGGAQAHSSKPNQTTSSRAKTAGLVQQGESVRASERQEPARSDEERVRQSGELAPQGACQTAQEAEVELVDKMPVCSELLAYESRQGASDAETALSQAEDARDKTPQGELKSSQAELSLRERPQSGTSHANPSQLPSKDHT